MIVLSVGMPRAGSGWHYNLIHDLMRTRGCAEATEIRHRFHLENVLTEVNCNIGVLSARRLALVSIPALLGQLICHQGPLPAHDALSHAAFAESDSSNLHLPRSSRCHAICHELSASEPFARAGRMPFHIWRTLPLPWSSWMCTCVYGMSG